LVIANHLPLREVNHGTTPRGIPADSVRTPAALASVCLVAVIVWWAV
jgi:hypothetical protein